PAPGRPWHRELPQYPDQGIALRLGARPAGAALISFEGRAYLCHALVGGIPDQRVDHPVRNADLRSAAAERRRIADLAVAHLPVALAGASALRAFRPHLFAQAPPRD